MRAREYTTELSDAQIADIIRRRKRKQRMIRRVTTRVGILLFVLCLLVFGVATCIQKFFMTDTLAADLYPTSEDVKGIIFLDPGHGGYDAGYTHKRRAEKYDTLALGLLVRQELENRGYKVVMSRTRDTSLSGKERARLANEASAGIMVSLHRSKGPNGQGFDAYISTENRKRDRKLGKRILKALQQEGISFNNGVHRGTDQSPKEDYPENKYSNMPSVLIMYGYINDREDNKFFDKHKEAYASATAEAIDTTYTKLYIRK